MLSSDRSLARDPIRFDSPSHWSSLSPSRQVPGDDVAIISPYRSQVRVDCALCARHESPICNPHSRSPFRSFPRSLIRQVALINDKLRTRVNSVDKIDTSYECLTIDKAQVCGAGSIHTRIQVRRLKSLHSHSMGTQCVVQGRDKAMVIVSLVKSNDRHDPGKLLGDLRRVNVAMTRAQSKLVLIGDSSTLIHLELFAGIVRFIKENGWMVSVGGQ